MGKTLHNTGWKIGYSIAKPEISNEIRKLHQFTVFSVNTPAQYAIARFMEEQSQFFKTLPEFYQQKRDFFFDQMKNGRRLDKSLEIGSVGILELAPNLFPFLVRFSEFTSVKALDSLIKPCHNGGIFHRILQLRCP